MKKRLRINIPIYGVPINFIAGFDEAVKHGLDPREYWGAMVATRDSEVWFVLGGDYANNANTVAHESLHAAWRILDFVGVDVSSENHEALAYVIGWVNAEAVHFFNKHYARTE